MRILLLSLFFIITNLGVSQNPYSITIDKASGLPSNSIYDIFQDSKGFMWFATGKGLCRYDGNNTKVFTADFQTSKSGSCIAEDAFGRIWYCNFDGYLYYVQNNQLVAFQQKNSIGYYEFGILGNYLFTIQKNSIEVYDLKKLKLIKKIKFDNTYFKATHLSKKYFYVFTNKLLKIDSNNTHIPHNQ